MSGLNSNLLARSRAAGALLLAVSSLVLSPSGRTPAMLFPTTFIGRLELGDWVLRVIGHGKMNFDGQRALWQR